MERRIKGVLLDLDGTLIFKGSPLPRAVEALQALQVAGVWVRILTNADSRTPPMLVELLQGWGFSVNEEQIFTPVSAAVGFMERRRDKRFHLLVSPQVEEYFRAQGLVSDEGSCEGLDEGGAGGIGSDQAEPGEAARPGSASFSPADFVLVGEFRSRVTYDALNLAFRQLMGGAELVALQKGRFYIREEGYNLDTGSFVKLLEFASGKEARLLGKPSPEFMRLAVESLGSAPEETLVVGDDVTSDIAGAQAVGARGILVRTGKFEAQDQEGLTHCFQPEAVLDSVSDLAAWLEQQS